MARQSGSKAASSTLWPSPVAEHLTIVVATAVTGQESTLREAQARLAKETLNEPGCPPLRAPPVAQRPPCSDLHGDLGQRRRLAGAHARRRHPAVPRHRSEPP